MPSNLYYTTSATPAVGLILYSDFARTVPVANGFYSDGTNCYTVDSTQSPFIAGYIISSAVCPTPTPTPTLTPTQTPSNTPTNTITPTKTPTNTPTPTTTPTKTPPTYTITILAQTNSSINTAPPEIGYTTNAGSSWTSKFTTLAVNPSFSTVYTFSVQAGTNVGVAMRNFSSANVTFGANTTGSPGSTGFCGRSTGTPGFFTVSNIQANTTIYMNGNVTSQALTLC